MMKQIQTLGLAAIVLLISAVFVLQFGGPQAQGCSNVGGVQYAAQVYGDTITRSEFRAAYRLAGFDRVPSETAEQYGLQGVILDGLVERNLLARQASDLGFAVTEDEVMRRLADEGTVYLSLGVDAPVFLGASGARPAPVQDENGDFDKEAAKRFIQYGLRRSVAEFAESQVLEALAHRMRETLLATVRVGPEEVWNRYVQDTERAEIAYVRFSPAWYRRALEAELDDAAVDAFVEAEAERVAQAYEARKHEFTGLEKQVRARHVLIKVDPGADDVARQEARERAEAALARAKAGEDFAALARELSEDPGSAAKGGDLGWNPRGRMVPAFDEAMFALGAGEMTDELVESPYGFHVIRVEGVREGDVPEAEAKREVAEALYLETEARRRARAAAEEALEALRGGASLAELHRELTGRPLEGEAVDEDGAPLPELETIQPQVRTSEPFGRGGQPITGSFDATPLARAAFEDLSPDAPLPEAPMELGGEFVVYALESRTEAQRSGLTDDIRRRLEDELLAAKGQETLELYLARLRDEAEADGALRVDASMLAGTGEEDATGGG